MALTVQDRLDILELAAQYNKLIDRKDLEGWLDTWTPDGAFESAFGTFQGRDALQQFLLGFFPTAKGKRHVTVNDTVGGDGENATLSCYLIVVEIESNAAVVSSGEYTDTLRKNDDGVWKFVSRKLIVDPSWKG